MVGYSRGVQARNYLTKEVVGQFNSMQEATNYIGGHKNGIAQAIRRKGTYYGYIWEEWEPPKPTTKVCRRCHVELPLKCFKKIPSKGGIYRSYCIECNPMVQRLSEEKTKANELAAAREIIKIVSECLFLASTGRTHATR